MVDMLVRGGLKYTTTISGEQSAMISGALQMQRFTIRKGVYICFDDVRYSAGCL